MRIMRLIAFYKPCFQRKTDPSTRKKYTCSPSEGPCCKAETCSFRGLETICSSELDCTFEQACNGSSPKCPKPKSKQDNTWCHKETMVCKDGQCSQSACNFHAGTLEPCECEVDETKGKTDAHNLWAIRLMGHKLWPIIL